MIENKKMGIYRNVQRARTETRDSGVQKKHPQGPKKKEFVLFPRNSPESVAILTCMQNAIDLQSG